MTKIPSKFDKSSSATRTRTRTRATGRTKSFLRTLPQYLLAFKKTLPHLWIKLKMPVPTTYIDRLLMNSSVLVMISFVANFLLSGLLFSAFSIELWQFYLSHGIQFLSFCKYGLIRSLLSKCVGKFETGKIFSALAIVSAVVPFAGNPAFRKLYSNTIDTFPSAEILLASAVALLTAVLNFILYTQKHRMLKNEDSEDKEMNLKESTYF